MHDDLDIPDFLKRAPVPAGSIKFDEPRPRKKKLTPKQEFERDIARIADRRWRNGTVDENCGRRFQSLRVIKRDVRAELRRRDRKQAATST